MNEMNTKRQEHKSRQFHYANAEMETLLPPGPVADRSTERLVCGNAPSSSTTSTNQTFPTAL
jgi:hypothetical protein